MGKINVLDFQVANLIAAGEVVERPASAVKELVENSIDAGAKNITVEIKRGGIAFIRVTDDGSGISKEDLPVSILRHATSKIKNANDLDGITTLGFRGEALAAISSVSHIRILSRTPRSDSGYVLEAQAGDVLEIYESGMQSGTTIIVEELFANVPARRKFLKRDVSEAMAVTAVIEKSALAHPDISFHYICDGTVKFATAGDGKLKNTIYSIFGRDFTSKLIEIDDMDQGISVKGYIGTPENIRANRNFENFFINNRYVKSRTAMAAIEQAFQSFIPSDKFPCCVLNITIHPAFVDVNVHPTKLEVKFSDERVVFDRVYSAVRNSLSKKIDRPEVSFSSVNQRQAHVTNAFKPVNDRSLDYAKPTQSTFFEIPVAPTNVTANLDNEETKSIHIASTPTYDTVTVTKDNLTRMPVSNTIATSGNEPVDDQVIPNIRYRIVGELFNSYVVLELPDTNTSLLVDKHAAHERINFERMKKNLHRSIGESQILLVPQYITLDPNSFAALNDNIDEISSLGYKLDLDESSRVVTISAYPQQIKEEDALTLIDELCDQLQSGTGNTNVKFNELLEKALYQSSCKASIKAGHIEDPAHIKWICDNLLALDDIKYCPHGRPVAIELSKDEIEKQFKRK